MDPFESLVKELGNAMNIPLKVDQHQSCLLLFNEGIAMQIDLDMSGEKILLGTQLGLLPPGPYREKMLSQALRVNALPRPPRGYLAYSEKMQTLVLFQFLPLARLNGEALYRFLQLFLEHARVWRVALERGEVPEIQEDQPEGSGFFGLTR